MTDSGYPPPPGYEPPGYELPGPPPRAPRGGLGPLIVILLVVAVLVAGGLAAVLVTRGGSSPAASTALPLPLDSGSTSSPEESPTASPSPSGQAAASASGSSSPAAAVPAVRLSYLAAGPDGASQTGTTYTTPKGTELQVLGDLQASAPDGSGLETSLKVTTHGSAFIAKQGDFAVLAQGDPVATCGGCAVTTVPPGTTVHVTLTWPSITPDGTSPMIAYAPGGGATLAVWGAVAAN